MSVVQCSVGFVSPDDLERLTGYPSSERKRQRQWLEERGFVYAVNARDEPVVLWEHLREKLCLRASTHGEEPQLDFGAVFAAAPERRSGRKKRSVA